MSQTEYLYTMTVACPDHLCKAANHLAVAIGQGAGDFDTFSHAPTHQDANGNQYVVICTAATGKLFEFAGGEMKKRDFAPDGWDANEARRAQGLIQIWFGPSEQEPTPPKAVKNKIVGVLGDDTQAVIAAMGLTRLPEELN